VPASAQEASALEGGRGHECNWPLSLPVGRANGFAVRSVISCDSIVTVPKAALERQIGFLLPAQESELTAAIHAAFDLD
jgi:mRNA-degrading endonuclease toxin of MazEF toxin-antitoxin module